MLFKCILFYILCIFYILKIYLNIIFVYFITLYIVCNTLYIFYVTHLPWVHIWYQPFQSNTKVYISNSAEILWVISVYLIICSSLEYTEIVVLKVVFCATASLLTRVQYLFIVFSHKIYIQWNTHILCAHFCEFWQCPDLCDLYSYKDIEHFITPGNALLLFLHQWWEEFTNISMYVLKIREPGKNIFKVCSVINLVLFGYLFGRFHSWFNFSWVIST